VDSPKLRKLKEIKESSSSVLLFKWTDKIALVYFNEAVPTVG